jgi:general secretion pathway protein K
MARRRPRTYSPGIALLATMLAVALMTMLVVDLTTSAALGYRSAANRADELKAYYLARSGVAAGLALLQADSINDSMQRMAYDGLDEPWAQPVPPIRVGGGTVSFSVVDEARKLNIDLLFNPRARAVDGRYAEIILRLLANLNISPDLLPVLIDWLDPDSIDSQGGAEADYYLTLVPPYEPRNGPMPTIGDLRMLKGMDDVTFMMLRQYLTTMPERRVNLNTAPPEVLAALTPELENTPALVKEILAARLNAPFTNATDVLNLPGLGQYQASLAPLIGTRSDYFLITGMGEFAGARKAVYATFRRGLNGAAMLMNWHED